MLSCIIIDHDHVEHREDVMRHFKKVGIDAPPYSGTYDTTLYFLRPLSVEAIRKAIKTAPISNASIGDQKSWCDIKLADALRKDDQ